MNRTILIVDDEPMITMALSTLIKTVLGYKVIVSNNPIEALKIPEMVNKEVDMVISDFLMPGLNGLQFLINAKVMCPDAVLILLTAYADKENAIRSINEVGIYYYMEKPWNNNEIIKVIKNGFERKDLKDNLINRSNELEKMKRENDRLYEIINKDYEGHSEDFKNIMILLCNIIYAKNICTDEHSRRVSKLAKLIGENLNLDREVIEKLEISALVHDIGKIGIPDDLLNKKEKLTERDIKVLRSHTVIGEDICKHLKSMDFCMDIIRHHHEKLNGTGYPDEIRGEDMDIPLRIVQVADIFDALYSKRPYKDRLALIEAKEILNKQANMGEIDRDVLNSLYDVLEKGEEKSIYD